MAPRNDRDRVFDLLVDRLESLEERLTTAVDKLEQQLGEHRNAVDERIDALEKFHILEQEKVRTRVATRTIRLERWQKASAAGGLLGVAALMLTGGHGLGWW